MSKAAELPTKDTIALIINRKNIDKVTTYSKTSMAIRLENMKTNLQLHCLPEVMSQDNSNSS